MIIRNNPAASPFLFPNSGIISGKFGAYSTDNAIANYPFTSDYASTINPSDIFTYASAPTITSKGIAVVGTTTQGAVPTTGFLVNNFSMSFTVEGFDTNPATAVITEKSAVSTNYFTISRESNVLRVVKYSGGTNNIIATPVIADITAATGYNFLVECSDTTGFRFKVDEIGGSTIVDTTLTTTAAKADMTAWGATMQIGRRAATLGISMHLSSLRIAPL